MKKLNFLISAIIIFGLTLLHGCRKEVVIPTFNIADATINDNGYTMGGSLVLLYSLDNGDSYASELPTDVPMRTELMVKVNNGSVDLTSEYFTFDWSVTSVEPDSGTLDIFTFKVFGEVSNLSVTVNARMTLITSHRSTGQFSRVNDTTGVITPLFTATTGGNDLSNVRGFVYHDNEDQFYMSQASYTVNGSNRKGYLYTIDPATKESTIINANNGAGGAAIWDAVNNWGVAEDDSLMGYGDFNSDGNGIVKFGTDGGRSLKTLRVTGVCCGLGMLFRDGSDEMIIGNGRGVNNGEVKIDRIDMNTGVVTNVITTSNLVGFTSDLSIEWLTVKALAQQDDGTIYGIIYPYNTKTSYFVSIDMSNTPNVTYISTLGEGNLNQFNMLAYVPNYSL